MTKILESESLVMVRILRGQISLPWEIIEEVEEISQHIQQQQISIQHTLREGNQLVDYLINHALQEGTDMVARKFMQMPKGGLTDYQYRQAIYT